MYQTKEKEKIWRDEWKIKNKDHINAYNRIYRKKIRQEKKRKLIELLGNRCIKCRQQFPDYVYDFHHLDPKIKSFNLGHGVAKSINDLIKEAEKCILLCANCHRIYHYENE